MLYNHGRSPSQPARAGQAVVLLALTLFALLGYSALAIDVAFAYAKRRLLRNAADAVALAGARALFAGQTDIDVITAEAQAALEQNLLANHDSGEGLRPTQFQV